MSRDTVRSMEILLVEDSMLDAKVALEALKQDKMRCRVTLVCDGEEAIRFLCRQGEFAQAPTPDLVLLDMLLPKKDGRQVLAEMRGNDELKQTPVFVLTSAAQYESILQADGLHVDGFIAKPVQWTAFIEEIKSQHHAWLIDLLFASVASGSR